MITKLYKGSVLLDFDDVKHQFKLMPNGERIIGVTSCTGTIDKSRPLIFWAVGLAKQHLLDNIEKLVELKSSDQILAIIEEAARQHQIKKEAAATTGSLVHEWIEKFIKAKVKKDIPKLPKEVEALNGVQAFLKWTDQHNVEFLSSERIVFSKKYKYAGIMDAEAKIDGKIGVVDFKTSNGIYNEYRYQVAAYQAAAEEEAGKSYAANKWIVRFGKTDGEFEAHQFDDQDKDFKTFLAALTIKRRENELYKPYKK